MLKPSSQSSKAAAASSELCRNSAKKNPDLHRDVAGSADATRQAPGTVHPIQDFAGYAVRPLDEGTNNLKSQYFPIFEATTRDNEEEFVLPVNETIERQPRSRPISHEQLTAEVKGIYAGLQMVEQKCIQVINDSRKANAEGKPETHWQALIALHRTLLHEHHDFLLASQHPSASRELRALASKYSMPARMWKHGIHNFLERLRHSLPGSHEYMLAFLILSYQMVSLLYETVPTFRQTWIECLGDLSRYRMAIEEENPKDREVWTQVSRYWYFKAADESPFTGRIYHHLAILSRTQPVQQLMLYSCALTAKVPFLSANESINTLLDPAIERVKTANKVSAPEIYFVCVFALLYKGKDYASTLDLYMRELEPHVRRLGTRFREQAAQMAIVLLCALRSFGSKDSVLNQVLLQNSDTNIVQRTSSGEQAIRSTPQFSPDKAKRQISQPLEIWVKLFEGLLNCPFEAIAPYVYVSMCFAVTLVRVEFDFTYVLDRLPWSRIAKFLDNLYKKTQVSQNIGQYPDSTSIPIIIDGETPTPEDFFLRTHSLPQLYPDLYPNEVCTDQEERSRETEETTNVRNSRIFRAAIYLAKRERWLNYDPDVGFEAITRDRWSGKSPPSATVSKRSTGSAMLSPTNVKIVDEDTEMLDISTC